MEGLKNLISMLSRHQRTVFWCAMIVVLPLALVWGVQLRRWAFDYHQPLRFQTDIRRGWHWGYECLTNSFLEPYHQMANQPSDPDSMMWLDYAPLRLGAMTLWAWINSHRFPGVSSYQDTYEFAKPILYFNLGIEIVLGLGLFVLVRHWMRRSDPDVFLGGNLHAIAAALFAWFNPSTVLSAHCWPTWDVWVPAFFVWAVYMAVLDRWFVSGLIIGLGLMMKGQHFFIAPLFLLWPLFTRRWEAPLRWLCGAVLAVGVVASPWLLTYVRKDVGRAPDWLAIGFVLLAVGWAVEILLLLLLLHRRISMKLAAYVLAATLGGSLLACMAILPGHLSWMRVSWGFGVRHWDAMMTGPGSNLASLLELRFGWSDPHMLAIGPFTIKQTLFALYGVLLFVCCIGIAIQYSRNDRRFLIAIVTPWVLFFAFCPHLHERYLSYATALSAIFVTFGVGMSLLAVVISAISWIMTIHVMFIVNGRRGLGFGADISPTFGHSLRQTIQATHPDLGWAVVLCALILLYLSIMPTPRDELLDADEIDKDRQPDRAVLLPTE